MSSLRAKHLWLLLLLFEWSLLVITVAIAIVFIKFQKRVECDRMTYHEVHSTANYLLIRVFPWHRKREIFLKLHFVQAIFSFHKRIVNGMRKYEIRLLLFHEWTDLKGGNERNQWNSITCLIFYFFVTFASYLRFLCWKLSNYYCMYLFIVD